MKLLGEITRLQIQRSSLTIGTGPTRYFDPDALLSVDELFLTRDGAFAPAPDAGFLVDVHNATHPFTRSRGENTLCLGFSRHYDTMQEKFGTHYAFGCAGENIIIDGPATRIALTDLATGVLVETEAGLVPLGSVIVATPCMPFAKFALNDPHASTDAIKSTIQFLDHGLRGFYCAFAGTNTAKLHLGAKAFTAA